MVRAFSSASKIAFTDIINPGNNTLSMNLEFRADFPQGMDSAWLCTCFFKIKRFWGKMHTLGMN